MLPTHIDTYHAMITTAIIELLEHGLVARTIEELTKAVSNMLGVKSDHQAGQGCFEQEQPSYYL